MYNNVKQYSCTICSSAQGPKINRWFERQAGKKHGCNEKTYANALGYSLRRKSSEKLFSLRPRQMPCHPRQPTAGRYERSDCLPLSSCSISLPALVLPRCAQLRTSLRNQLQLSDSTPLVRRVCTTYRQPSIYELSAISQYVHVLMPQGNNHSGGHSPPSSLLS